MDKKTYNNFCYKYDIDPTDYDAVLYTVDELEGMYGDKTGKLQLIREYVYNNMNGELPYSSDDYSFDDDNKVTKDVFVYQIKDIKDCNYAFMSYEFALKNGGVDLDNYEMVATVNVNVDDASDIGNILEIVFAYGNSNPKYYADNPKARSISVSDLLKVDGVLYYVDSIGFKKVESQELTESEELPEEDPDTIDDASDDTDFDKTALDYLDDLQNRQMSVAELNVVLQSIFGRFNDIFLIESDLYNADLDETQVLEIWDDDDWYKIYYDIIDVQDGIIEITKSIME